jgi:hypothetical protein
VGSPTPILAKVTFHEMSLLKTFYACRFQKKTGYFMFWRDKHKKQYYYNTDMKMINDYLFPICNQKIKGDIYIKTS